MDYIYFEKPVVVQNDDQVYCPYVKVDNPNYNNGVSTPRNLYGQPAKKVCLPNLSYRGPPVLGAFGNNVCRNNKAIHLNFDNKNVSECYSEPSCTQKLETCYDPYLGM